jgi:hypothetical protein
MEPDHAANHGTPWSFAVRSIRPLVRYVDEAQAVIDVWFELGESSGGDSVDRPPPSRIDVEIELTAADGYVLRRHARATLHDRSGVVRFEMLRPARWWPLGMGEQCLYDMTVMLSVGDELVELWQTTLGLTSVRMPRPGLDEPRQLLINGQVRSIQTIVPVAPIDEAGVLPVGDQSLLVIRDHFAPDVLLEAADRAGVLVVQAIPRGDGLALPQIDRLVPHPSLAGWLVEDASPQAPSLISRLRQLDPTRPVLDRLL